MADLVAVIAGDIVGPLRAVAGKVTHLVAVVAFHVFFAAGAITCNVVIFTTPRNTVLQMCQTI